MFNQKNIEVCIEPWVKNRDTNRTVSLVHRYSFTEAVLIYYMYAATGSWMFAGKCILPADLPHFFHLFY